MHEAIGEYTDWRFVDYNPAVAELLPHSLLRYLTNGQTALDIGCNTGAVSLFLATHGVRAHGVDLNPDAIGIARERAKSARLSHLTNFVSADITQAGSDEKFDAVLLIRLLTCFPSLQSHRLILHRANSLLRQDGLIYIHDFKYNEGDNKYQDRYAEGVRRGWRSGNFAVNDAAGNLLFIAHHHSEDEIRQITSNYEKLELNSHSSLSMNGHRCQMFEFIGRKSSMRNSPSK